ncbi:MULTISPECIES: glycosyl hydrolase family 95 catalytic domain-containing protein [unclassified Lentimonas]|uniref:glycosyl hydrolase family 95 catalytic domain-containing protein n=1 Tax=unclassified Lentimonas TaxID=2630993 RepID=UPI001328035C|nr:MULTISPECIES: hypothetical protein [unclassified Lentimonas]CAA6689510.1 Unannotated [Lentimonas sp. CC19]CAA6692521.1 Unannotated [Lentimonas sp. CC10]CAA7069160.1 Unannotated [Lentimonas sp. CC11]
MKDWIKKSILLMVIFSASSLSAEVKSDVDWPEFIARHDLVWTEMPQAWHDGPFMGNGMLGSMLHQMDDHTLRISLGRSDVEDNKKKGAPFITKSRLPNGYFTLKTIGKITGFEGRLDLYNAEARGRILTDKGAIDLQALVHSDDMLILYRLQPSGGEATIALDFVPLRAIAPARLQAEIMVAEQGDKAHSSRQGWAAAPYEYNPDPVLTKIDGYSVSKQALVVGGEIGTAWSVKSQPNGGTELRVSIEHSSPEATATQDAVNHLKAVVDESWESLVTRHRVWWHDYYPQSFLSLSDTEMESFYWIQVYKFGSGARQGRAYMDVMGPWMVENTAWANGWFDLNTQLSYWFLSTANRLEVAESLFTKMDESFDTFVANMPAKYKGQAAATGSISPQTFDSPLGERLGFMGDFTWLCHNYWMFLERTMDEERVQENYFPLLTKAVNYYVFNMYEGEDGRIHLPTTRSPEYGGGIDCTYNLSLFRWGCQTLIQIDERYGINDPLLPKWKDIVARLADYPTNENGLMVAADFPFAKAHRHYSHLLAIHPLNTLHMEQPENQELIQKSVDHWTSFFDKGLTGYAYTGGASMAALQGDAERAADYLNMFMRMHELNPKNATRIHRTTMYTETGRIQPVTETPFSLCDSMQLMVLQTWNGTIRVFPAVPEVWQDVVFDQFLAPGGFEISASRKDGVTQFVSIKSNAGEPCFLKLDFQPKRVEGIAKSAVTRLPDGRFEVAMQAGDQAIFYADHVDVAQVAPVNALPENCNSFGLN